MRTGAYDYITMPIDYEELVLGRTRPRAAAPAPGSSSASPQPALLSVLEVAARAALTDSTVLIRGETGTGKELLAKAIHRNSRRKDQPFVTINSSAIPADLIESELFTPGQRAMWMCASSPLPIATFRP